MVYWHFVHCTVYKESNWILVTPKNTPLMDSNYFNNRRREVQVLFAESGLKGSYLLSQNLA